MKINNKKKNLIIIIITIIMSFNYRTQNFSQRWHIYNEKKKKKIHTDPSY